MLPPFEGSCHGDLGGTKGQRDIASVLDTADITIIEATAKQRSARGGTRNHLVAMGRSEHKPGNLVDIWYDPPTKDIPYWRGPSANSKGKRWRR